IDREPKCCAIIKDNLEKTRLLEHSHIYCSSVLKALTFLNKEYDIILVDPPYSDSSIGDVLEKLATSKLVGEETTLVVTHSTRLALDSHYATLSLIKEHRHGDSCIALYRKEGEE
ncbi:RsmD family RNA methyltransferase, partial [Chloroflexota bacterium]